MGPTSNPLKRLQFLSFPPKIAIKSLFHGLFNDTTPVESPIAIDLAPLR